ncbi:MAG: HlyD family secretion protein, partial [Clostridiales bacterium]|nr:HlyD family secretion protein [Clostridiales bacterium]
FTAVIKEVSEYPDPSGSDYVYSGNSNASYYPFYALIDDPEGIEEEGAEMTLSDAYADSSDSVCLDSYFVRTDSTGNNYVYVQGEDGKLEMRYVTTGRTFYDYYIEITAGLSESDLITFPYGDNVYEGAPTQEVDSLDEASWYDYS